jgi:hypothetical protein
MAHCELLVGGQLSGPILELLRSRFGEVTTQAARTGTVVLVDGLDQSSQRALLTLLWDTGHDVISLRSDPLREEPQ